MSRMFRMILAAVVCFAVLGASSVDAQAQDNQRRQWLKKYDNNKDKSLKGKEVRRFKKDHPEPYRRLATWCQAAKERPKKHDVNLPKQTKRAKKFKCKKKRVDRPYMKAWVEKADPDYCFVPLDLHPYRQESERTAPV